MSLSIRIPSGEQMTDRKKVISRKRRRNQNAEIDELAALVSLPTPPQLQTASMSADSNAIHSLVPSSTSGNAPSAIDKISVLRLTTTFLKLHDFMKNVAPVNTENSAEWVSTNILLGLMQEAMDGFLVVLDKDANILYVSETITGYVGLSQQEVIGQNLVDITHSDSAAEIADCLKPSVVSSVTTHIAQDCAYVISQYRQFFLKFKSTVANSRFTTHTLVQVSGNLKVKIPPLKNDHLVEVVEPSVVGFIGECHLIKSSASILEISIPHSTFTSTVTLDFQPISIEARVKEIIGYDIEDFIGVDELDFIHPADYPRLLPARQYLVDTGHSVSPHFRFLCKSGDWLWMQVEGTLHCKTGTSIPLFYEYKARVLSQEGGRLKYIEQKELYASKSKHKAISSKLTNTSLCCKTGLSGKKPIVDSLKGAKMPKSAVEPVLQARSMIMRRHSELIKLLVDDNSTNSSTPQVEVPGCSHASHGTTPSSASNSTPSLTTESSTIVTRDCSTSQNGSVSVDTDASGSPMSLQMQAVSPLSYSSETQSPSTLQVSPSPTTSGSMVSSDSGIQIGWLASHQSGLQSSLDPESIPSPANLVPATSPTYSAQPMSNASQQSAMSPGQFLNQASPCSNYGSVISGASSSSDVAVSDVSSPPTVFSPDTGAGSHTLIPSDNSIPLSAFSIPFHDSLDSSFIPQAPLALSDFDSQIHSSFNFSFTHPYSSNLGTSSNLDCSALESQQQILDSCSSLFLGPDDFINVHQSSDGTPNSDTSNTSTVDAVAPLSESGCGMNIDSTLSNNFHPHHVADHDVMIQNSNLDSLSASSNNLSLSMCGSNPEVQDILQRFF